MNRHLPQWELTLVALTLAAAAWSATLSPYYLSVGQIELDPIRGTTERWI
jgi:hypothetical protein